MLGKDSNWLINSLTVGTIASGIILVQNSAVVAPVLAENNQQAIAEMAKDVTVVINGQNPGSGVIIAKNANTYTVLTAKHTIASEDEYEIVTSDGEKHRLNYRTVIKLPEIDLSLAEFTSDRSYRVAMLGDSNQTSEGSPIYISGWPHPGQAMTQRIFQITAGEISGLPLGELEDGYGLVYTNITRSGMSGGPIFDKNGALIGIHGRAEGEIIYNPDTGNTVDVKSGFNLGISLDTFLSAADRVGIQLPYLWHHFVQTQTISDRFKVLSVAMTADSQTIVSGLADGSIKFWHKTTGELVRTFTGDSGGVWSVAISADGQRLIGSIADRLINIWNVSTGETIHQLTGDPILVKSVSITADGETIASASAEDANIKIWDANNGELIRTLRGHTDYVNSVAIRKHSHLLVSGSSDRTAKLWNWQTGELLKTFGEHNHIVNAVAIDPFGSKLASGTYSAGDILGAETSSANNPGAEIKLWHLETGELLHQLTGHSQTITCLAIDPYGHLLASASYDGTIKIWNLHSGQLLQTLEVLNQNNYKIIVFSLAFSGDGRTLVSGDESGEIKIWSMS